MEFTSQTSRVVDFSPHQEILFKKHSPFLENFLSLYLERYRYTHKIVQAMWLSILFLSFFCIILFLLYKPERNYSSIGLYYRKIRIELSAVKYRRDVFRQVLTGEVVQIKPDPSKKYNGEAIGAFTQSGKLLGYIPRGQRRLINLFRDHPEPPALVYKKFQKGAHFHILIDVFLPGPHTRMLPARTSAATSSKQTSTEKM